MSLLALFFFKDGTAEAEDEKEVGGEDVSCHLAVATHGRASVRNCAFLARHSNRARTTTATVYTRTRALSSSQLHIRSSLSVAEYVADDKSFHVP